MLYTIVYSERAKKEVQILKQLGNKIALKKLQLLLEELQEHPTYGTRKTRTIKRKFSRKMVSWSHRINEKHRLVYEIFDDKVVVEVIQAYGHYDDK